MEQNRSLIFLLYHLYSLSLAVFSVKVLAAFVAQTLLNSPVSFTVSVIQAVP